MKPAIAESGAQSTRLVAGPSEGTQGAIPRGGPEKERRQRLKAFIRDHTTKGFFDVICKANSEWRIYRRHRSGLKKIGPLLERAEKKLNLGCGPENKPGWINIDLFDPRADLQLDLRERWPFADGSVSYVYSEHSFEHFELHEEVAHLLSESYRVLRQGGVFDVGVPDTEWPLQAYGNPTDPYWRFAKTVHPAWCATQLDHLNYHFRQDAEHKYAWDYETLGRALRQSGFTNIHRREHNSALDSEHRKIGTLYVTAAKPI